MDNKVYCLILNFNSSQDSVELFINLKKLDLSNLIVMVIDNGSRDEDLKQLKQNIPTANLIFNHNNLGYAGGNNIGIEIALKDQADYVWILNPDIRVNDQTLPILLKTISEDTSLAAIGPRIIHKNKPDKIFSDGGVLHLNENYSSYHKNHNIEVANVSGNIDYDINYIDGSCILLNCRAVKEIGYLPEDYFLYFEETDWCFKARKNNWRLAINSNASVFNLTSLKKAGYYYYMSRNKLIFCKKYHPDFVKVRKYFLKELLKEALFRFKGNYFKPFYLSRVKGFVFGIIKTSF